MKSKKQHTLQDIIEKRNEFERLGREDMEANARKMSDTFVLPFNYHSNKIEGNKLSYNEVCDVVKRELTDEEQENRDYVEIKGYSEAIKLLYRLGSHNERFLTEADIRELHKLSLVRDHSQPAKNQQGVLTVHVGAYKTRSNSVLQADGTMFDYCHPSEVHAKMGELMDWLKSNFYRRSVWADVIALATEFHYRFVRIHPFDDGNGRVSRLLLNYVLIKKGLPPTIIPSTKKKKYIRLLELADKGNLNELIKWMTLITPRI